MDARSSSITLTADADVMATQSTGQGGSVVTINDPSKLPPAVRDAGNLKVAFGGVEVAVTRSATGAYSFTVPANAKVHQDVDGNLRVVFVMDDRTSEVVTLVTASPIHFNDPAIATNPSPAYLARGQSVQLTANTAADPTRFNFTWSYSSTGQAPWTAIPGNAASVTWLPPTTGPIFLQVAVADATGSVSSYTTPQAAVFVNDGGAPITSSPQLLDRGATSTLTLDLPGAGEGPFSWYWAKATGGSPQWTSLGSGGKTMPFVPTDVGAYVFRVDLPQPTGGLRSFSTTDPALTVVESKPLVTPGSQTIDRGERTGLTLDLAGGPHTDVTWYYAKDGATQTWTLMPGNGATNDFVADQAGTYDFRVDTSTADGTVKSFTTTNPVLNVIDTGPLIVSDPPNDIAPQGGSVTLTLNATGVDETNYKFIWSASTSANGPYNTLPFKTVDDLYTKHFTYSIPASFSPGAYYVKVDAIQRTGTATYAFTSGVPVFTVQK